LPELEDAEVVNPVNGYVLIQVADTTPIGQSYPVNQITFAPIDLNESSEIKSPRVVALEAKSESTSLFVVELEPKEYSLQSLRAYYNFQNAYLSQFYPAGIDLGTFTVNSGRMTDLGTLAVFIRRRGVDYFYDTARAPSTPRKSQLFRERFPNLAAGISNLDSPDTWNADGLDTDYADGYRLAVSRQVTFGQPLLDEATGAASFPGHMGLILNRTADRQWLLEALQEDVRVSSITTIDDQKAIVTEFDDIYVREEATGNWALESGPPLTGDLTFLAEHPQLGIVVLDKSERQHVVWTSPAWGLPWQQHSVFEPEMGLMEAIFETSGVPQAAPITSVYVASGDYIFLVINRRVYRYDLINKELEYQKLTGVESLQKRDDYVSASGVGWGSYVKVTFDNGETWKSIKTTMPKPEFQSAEKQKRQPAQPARSSIVQMLGHPAFVDKDRGFMMHDTKDEQDPTYVAKTVDGGKSWSILGQGALPDGCGTLILATEEELLVRCFLSGEYVRSDDGGVSWVTERSVSDS
jgi:hypothetical protein